MREAATRSLDQSLVNWLEQRMVGRLLMKHQMVGKSLLDVPCGYGRFWQTFTHLGLQLVGIDRDPAMTRKAAGNLHGDGSHPPVCGNIFTLPFEDETFDCVFCIRLLHLQFTDGERRSILRELARVSRRLVLISIYQPTPLHGLWRRVHGTPGRLRFTTAAQLTELLGQSELSLLELRPLQRGLHMQTFVLLSKADRGR